LGALPAWMEGLLHELYPSNQLRRSELNRIAALFGAGHSSRRDVANRYICGEFALEFFSVDRFIFRASDVFKLDEHSNQKFLDRLANCHVYFHTKRPRLSLVPDSSGCRDRDGRRSPFL
jgi:hypothetical protein